MTKFFITSLLILFVGAACAQQLPTPEMTQKEKDIKECKEAGFPSPTHSMNFCLALLELERRVKELNKKAITLKKLINPGIEI